MTAYARELERLEDPVRRLELEAKPLDRWTVAALNAYVGGLSTPSKMPGYAYGLPAAECITGSKLRPNPKSTCHYCYAYERGMYKFRGTLRAQYRRLEAIGRPLWAGAMAELINRRADRHPYFRWHDSGDLQSLEHLRAIVAVAELTPSVRHWLPTRENPIVAAYIGTGGTFPPNLNVRMSAHMVGGHIPTFARWPVTVSSVARVGDVPAHAHQCPAPHQGNACGDCRSCWDRNVPLVNYALH